MANNFEIKIKGQPFWNTLQERQIPVFFSMPEDSIIADRGVPGLCIITSGFGGEATANVYQKIRQSYADSENLVMIQCDYMGYEFMGKALQAELLSMRDALRNAPNRWITEGEWRTLKEKGMPILLESNLCALESRTNFCEMGVFQALDCLRAIKSVQDLMDSIEMQYNPSRIIGYGFSHGAYLLYLMNALYPNLFSFIIDNSAWLFPEYIHNQRKIWLDAVFSPEVDGCTIDVSAEICLSQLFHAKDYIDDLEMYDLRNRYRCVHNSAQIVSYHGEDDEIIRLKEKQDFLQTIHNAHLHVIDKNNIDHNIFQSTEHGLDADFIKLFSCALQEEKCISSRGDMWSGQIQETSFYRYMLTEEDGFPKLERRPLEGMLT